VPREAQHPGYAQEAKEIIEYLQHRGAPLHLIALAMKAPQKRIDELATGYALGVTKEELADLHHARRHLNASGLLSHIRALWAFILDEYLTQRFGEDYTTADARALLHGLQKRYKLSEAEIAELNATFHLKRRL